MWQPNSLNSLSPPLRSLDGGSSDVPEDVVRDFLEQQTGHLTPPHLSYFSHWLLLCCLEAATLEGKNGRKRVWLQTAEERSVCGPAESSPPSPSGRYSRFRPFRHFHSQREERHRCGERAAGRPRGAAVRGAFPPPLPAQRRTETFGRRRPEQRRAHRGERPAGSHGCPGDGTPLRGQQDVGQLHAGQVGGALARKLN